MTYEQLTAVTRNSRRRIEVLGWKRLSRLYRESDPGSPVRRAICAECRRLGYTPRIILVLHAE